MTDLVMTQRIFWPQYETIDKVRDLLAFFRCHSALVDEISSSRRWAMWPVSGCGYGLARDSGVTMNRKHF